MKIESIKLFKKVISFINKYPIFILCIYFILVLWPLLKSGYYSDDLIASTEFAKRNFEHLSFFSYYFDSLKNNFVFGDRLILFSPSEIFVYFFSNLVFYKSCILFAVITNILLFGRVIQNLTKDKRLGFFSMLFVPLLFQFRLNHDPILSFYGFQQFLVTYILFGVYLLSKYYENKKNYYLIGSVILYNFLL